MRFSGFLKETPVCKKKTHHKNIQKSRDKGQKLAQSLPPSNRDFFLFFFFAFFCFCFLRFFSQLGRLEGGRGGKKGKTRILKKKKKQKWVIIDEGISYWPTNGQHSDDSTKRGRVMCTGGGLSKWNNGCMKLSVLGGGWGWGG